MTMARLKTFNVVELFEILNACAHSLAFAYQEINQKDLNNISEQAYDACAYLLYEINKEQNTQTIH